MEKYIFISYRSSDNTKADNFKAIMELNGINCWMAPESIDPGSNYVNVIPAAINNCGVFVLLLSSRAQESGWIMKELDRAIKHGKPIIPVFIEKCELVDPFDFYLSNVQAWDILGAKRDNIKRIIDKIKDILKIESSEYVLPEHLFAPWEEKSETVAKKEQEYGLHFSDGMLTVGPHSPVDDVAVVGVGNYGCNVVDGLINSDVRAGAFIAINTDRPALSVSRATKKIGIGSQATHGFSAGGDPERGLKAAKDSSYDISETLSKFKLVIIIAGLGGGTGSGASPVVADIARNLGKIAVVFATTPFEFEGEKRARNAALAARKLHECADAVMTVSNRKNVTGSDGYSAAEEFKKTDGIIIRAVETLIGLVCDTGSVNIDIDDLRAVFKGGAEVFVGEGCACGENRANIAVDDALERCGFGEDERPVNVIVSVSGKDIALDEVTAVVNRVRDMCVANADILFGVSIDDSLCDYLGVTLIVGGKASVKYMPPPKSLLKSHSAPPPPRGVLEERAEKIQNAVSRLIDAEARIIDIYYGPQISRFDMVVPPGASLRRIASRAEDIGFELGVERVRPIIPLPDNPCAIGFEVPNSERDIVRLSEIVDTDMFEKAPPLSAVLGKTVDSTLALCDLEKHSNLLIAGQAGIGKSSFISSIIVGLIYKCAPSDIRFIFIDPKQVEFALFRGLPHMLFDRTITEPRDALNALVWAEREMERRFTLLSRSGCRRLSEYNALPEVATGSGKLPRIMIFIDEFSYLTASEYRREIEKILTSIAVKSRAAGIHLVISTQRPSADVISGMIKASFPNRAAFKVCGSIDSRIILDEAGAELLACPGDMLFKRADMPRLLRVQVPYVTDEETKAVVEYVKNNYPAKFDAQVEKAIFEPQEEEPEEPDYDPLLPSVLAFAVERGTVSVTAVQRRFNIGYVRSVKIIDYCEAKGYIGPWSGGKNREVLVTEAQLRAMFGDGE